MDNQSVKIRATADLQRVEGKLDKLASQMGFVAAQTQKAGRAGKRAGDDIGGGMTRGQKAAEGFKSTIAGFVGPAAVLAGLTATVTKLANEFERLNKEAAKQSQTAGQSLADVAFGTGLINTPGGMRQLEEAMRNNSNVFTPSQEFGIFNTVASADVRGKLTSEQEINLSARIADTVGEFTTTQAGLDSASKDIAEVAATGAFTEDEAILRGLIVTQEKGKNTGAIDKLAKLAGLAETAGLEGDALSEFVDSAIAVTMAATAGGARGSTAATVFASLEKRMMDQDKSALEEQGVTGDQLDKMLEQGAQRRARETAAIMVAAARGDQSAIQHIAGVSAQGVEIQRGLASGVSQDILRRFETGNVDQMITAMQGELTGSAALANAQQATQNVAQSNLAFDTDAQLRQLLRQALLNEAQSSGFISSTFEQTAQKLQFDMFGTRPDLAGLTETESMLRRMPGTDQEAFDRLIASQVGPEQQQQIIDQNFSNLNITVTVNSDESQTTFVQAD